MSHKVQKIGPTIVLSSLSARVISTEGKMSRNEFLSGPPNKLFSPKNLTEKSDQINDIEEEAPWDHQQWDSSG